MQDFIRVYDNVLSKEFCDNFLTKFDNSPFLTQGKTSGGVDLSKKNSQDLYLNQHIEYQTELQHILQNTTEKVFEYFEEHFFALIGAFYAIFGGLRAVAVSDTYSGVLLLVMAIVVVVLALIAIDFDFLISS